MFLRQLAPEYNPEMETKEKFDEKLLLMQVADGDQQAFTSIFNHYYPLLFSYLRRMLRSDAEAENIIQDVFTKIWMGREALAYVDRFRPYLWVMARHHALNGLRRMAARGTVHQAFGDALTVAPSSEEVREKELQLTLIDEAIAHLPEHCRQVWLMNRKQKIKQADIANQLGISLPTVKKYMQQSVASIMQYVKERSSLGFSILAILSFFSEKN